jgi:hypothetical protein
MYLTVYVYQSPSVMQQIIFFSLQIAEETEQCPNEYKK